MDRIALVGISWRTGGPDLLARFLAAAERRPELLRRLSLEASLEEAVYLATCNRVEVAFVPSAGDTINACRGRIFELLGGRRAQPGEAERTFRAWAGEGAVEHLFLVAAGLDSARVGEREISGQVRGAYDLARQHGVIGLRLELLFQAALKVSRRVHRMTDVGRGRHSLAEIALAQVRERLRRTPGAVALIGVSSMTERCAQELAQEGAALHVVNRTLSKAESLAGAVGGTRARSTVSVPTPTPSRCWCSPPVRPSLCSFEPTSSGWPPAPLRDRRPYWWTWRFHPM